VYTLYLWHHSFVYTLYLWHHSFVYTLYLWHHSDSIWHHETATEVCNSLQITDYITLQELAT